MSGEALAVLMRGSYSALLAAGFLARPAHLAPVEPRQRLGTPVEHATFETLHTASLAAPPLRAGLTEESGPQDRPGG
jgi:two-component system LytT family sensor kinase